MKDVTAAVVESAPVDENTELIWDEVRSKVVLFSAGEPLSFVSLDPSDNREDRAVKVAIKLVLGQGVSI